MALIVRELGLGLVGCAVWLAGVGCGGDSGAPRLGDGAGAGDSSGSGSSNTTTSSASGGGSDPGLEGVPGPGSFAPGDGPGVVYATDRIFVGDTSWDGSSNQANGWKEFGINLDGKTSTKDSQDLCKVAGGGSESAVYPDGNGGIDNSFGKNVLPLVLALSPDYGAQLNDAIDNGAFSGLVAIDELGGAANYNPLLARYYLGGALAAVPKFDGSDVFPVMFESVTNPNDVLSARAQFPSSYLTENTWVSGFSAVGLEVPGRGLTGGGFAFSTLHHAILVLKLDDAHHRVTRGTLAGILDTEEYIESLRTIVGNFDPGFCDGAAFDGFANQIRTASDILVDGTQDPNKVCNGISVGIGLTFAEGKLGPVSEPVAPPNDPCL